LLIERLKKRDSTPVIHIETGAEFRRFFQGETYTAKLSKSIIEQGYLMPEFMCVYIWGSILEGKFTGKEHLVFDGTPRKLLEAKMLQGVFPFYSFPKPWLIYLDVEHEESAKRISLRSANSGRKDDGAEALEKRRKAYEEDIVPTIEWYKTNPDVNFLDIDGERPIEEVHAEIVKKIGLE
ncbi:MAG: nucleoside monophosphate kinase, partial [Patescibacteria group bacterium]|nr:nucleoside monophosphate kinase [Patescibacteria group bacterium]